MENYIIALDMEGKWSIMKNAGIHWVNITPKMNTLDDCRHIAKLSKLKVDERLFIDGKYWSNDSEKTHTQNALAAHLQWLLKNDPNTDGVIWREANELLKSIGADYVNPLTRLYETPGNCNFSPCECGADIDEP